MNKKDEPLTEKLMVRLSVSEKLKIYRAAGKLNSSEYLRRCETFHRSFEPDFMAKLEKAAELSKQDVPTVIQQLLTIYMAQDFAINDTLGPTKTWARSFQYDSTGRLITGNELSEKVTKEVKEAAGALKKRLEGMKEGKAESITISRSEASMMSARL